MNAFDSSRIESFLEFWQQKPNSPEGKLTEAYNLALKDFDNKQTGLLRHIRPQKASGKLIPVFSEGSEHLIADFEEAEKHLADARADIEAYLVLTEAQPSMSDLNDKLFRARRAITEATLDARRTLERALRKTILPQWTRSKDDQKCRLQWTNEIKCNASSGLLSKTFKAGFLR
jgi:hypothetical protein